MPVFKSNCQIFNLILTMSIALACYESQIEHLRFSVVSIGECERPAPRSEAARLIERASAITNRN
jgi:hypothetical protein